MRRYVAVIVFGNILFLNAGGSVALADGASFRFTNKTSETIYLKS